MRRALLLLPLLVACGTPEYQTERRACTAEWNVKIPQDLYQRLVQRTRYEQRPSGKSTCTTTGNTTTCVDEMISVPIPYTDVETVDRNKPRRDAQIRLCTAQACQARYGNADCKT
ncbi:hypothetical protein [Frigidibacter sp. ROC022]|uniref:hypothetical protein n=1 Tax=Frigidibacter sp. ROC022 TaxID=2971796 RepID=UPI00215B727E|nr:hypothetical protein [Frigidibacter sp. ROC022]MCR8722684.1 hypothetical protein [Frigidibacter sp. ROC022]